MFSFLLLYGFGCSNTQRHVPARVQREGLLRERDADVEVHRSVRPRLAPEDRPPDSVSGRGLIRIARPPCVHPKIGVFVRQVVHQPNDCECLLQLLHQPD